MATKNRFVSAALAVLTSVVLASPAYAQLQCVGTVSKVALNPQGLVQVDYGYGVHYLCSVSQNHGDFTPETCKATYSMMMSSLSGSSRQLLDKTRTVSRTVDGAAGSFAIDTVLSALDGAMADVTGAVMQEIGPAGDAQASS